MNTFQQRRAHEIATEIVAGFGKTDGNDDQQVLAAIHAAYAAGFEDGKDAGMSRTKKVETIRREIENDHLDMTWDEREKIVRDWVRYPLWTLRASLDAGFLYPSADNPHVNPDAAREREKR